MLKMEILPHVPVSCIAVTSLEGKSIWVQLSVQRDAFSSRIDLDLAGLALCVVGYIAIQSLVAMVLPRKFIAGSCSAIILILSSINLPLLMRSCWEADDLLMFCCQILRSWGVLAFDIKVSIVSGRGCLAASRRHCSLGIQSIFRILPLFGDHPAPARGLYLYLCPVDKRGS